MLCLLLSGGRDAKDSRHVKCFDVKNKATLWEWDNGQHTGIHMLNRIWKVWVNKLLLQKKNKGILTQVLAEFCPKKGKYTFI
jgi:hypothetical protein